MAKANSYDVVVVGSGPAGSSAAHSLARNGLKVAILEKQTLPRYKTCGGGVVQRAVQLLPTAIEQAVETKCHAAELHLASPRLMFTTTREQPIVYMTMRDRFDFLLVRAAEKVGAKIHSQCEVSKVLAGAESVRLVTTKGDFHARFVVAADGALSRVALSSGWGKLTHLAPALECEVQVSGRDFAQFAGRARFDFGVIENGYAWVFPKDNHLSIGVLNARRGRTNLNKCFGTYLKTIGIQEIKSIIRHGFVVPASVRRGPLVKNRILLAGDAAGFADPVTFEGITFAIKSGQLAAATLLQSELEEEETRQLYTRILSQEILGELRVGKLLGLLTYGLPRIRNRLFRRYGQKLCEVMTDVYLGKTTYRQVCRRILRV